MAVSPTTSAPDHPAAQRHARCTDVAESLTVLAWRDAAVERAPGAVPTDSDEALVTGRVHVFDGGECCPAGQ